MNREFLYELLETASVSGFEEEIQRKVIKYAKGFADEIYTDEIADVVSIVNPDAEIKSSQVTISSALIPASSNRSLL
jgi:putative aminopeptidase FrvX